MPPRRAPAVFVAVAVAVALGGCGSGSDVPSALPTDAVVTAVTPAVTAPPSASPVGAAKKAKPAVTVAPEVVLPSTTDTRSQAALSGWQGTVVAQLRRIDPRLVTNQANAISKVRATCEQMSTGMFETKVLPIIMQRFSNASITVTDEMAQSIYAVLLQDACYVMGES